MFLPRTLLHIQNITYHGFHQSLKTPRRIKHAFAFFSKKGKPPCLRSTYKRSMNSDMSLVLEAKYQVTLVETSLGLVIQLEYQITLVET